MSGIKDADRNKLTDLQHHIFILFIHYVAVSYANYVAFGNTTPGGRRNRTSIYIQYVAYLLFCGTGFAFVKVKTLTEDYPMKSLTKALENTINRLAAMDIGRSFFTPRESHMQEGDIFARLDMEAKPERRRNPIAARQQYSMFNQTASETR